jgi:PTH1 family peptidyl-tRNA hydrolase
MRLVVGLGNPGERYRRTRHNVGFRVLELLAARAGAQGRFVEDAWLAEARLGDEQVLLVKPLAFMNCSGPPLERLLAASGGSPADLVVIVDDVALELGTVRVRERGRDGGHNGLRSIAESLGTIEYPRVRVGVRDPGRPLAELPAELAGYVLAEFPQEQGAAVDAAVLRAADAAECLLREGVGAAMSRFNGGRALGL